MNKQHRQTICLAMIVRDEASTIERCLLAARPFIDSWVIHDMGSSDDTVKIINSTLRDIQGYVESHKLKNYSSARNELLKAAEASADLILMIDADEELQSIEEQIQLNEGISIGVLDITHNDYTTRAPRLFKSGELPKFKCVVGEHIATTSKKHSLINGVSLKHHNDGIRHRESRDTVAYRYQVESIIEGSNKTPAETLSLAQLALRQNKKKQALALFDEIIKNHVGQPQFWLASYLAANIHQSQGDNNLAIQLYQQCFESDPSRAEPVMRLAELHQQYGEHQTAKSLCDLIANMTIPTQADYYEPALYQHKAKLLQAETASKVDDWQTAETALEFLQELNGKGLKQSEQKLIKELQQRASQHKAGNVINNHDVVITESKPDKATSNPTLTIGMATHDDFDGVYFSIVSLVLYHTELLDQIEILVIDNNPNSKHGDAVKGLCKRVSQARYIPSGEYQGTAVRERIFAEAKGEMVICMDCHVFLHEGAVSRLIEYLEAKPNSKDLLHGPLFYDNHDNYSTHMEPIWQSGFYGKWGSDPRGFDIDAEPFEIPLQGMGLFACTKRHWQGFNHRFRGFGGEEGYIHEKFRQNGGKVLCLPFLRWTHRFDRPNSPNYPNRWQDRVRNYLIGWHELGLERRPILEHFAEHINLSLAANTNASFVREINSPLWGYDTIYVIVETDDQWAKTQPSLQALAIENLAQRIDNHDEIPRLLETAHARALKDVLLIDGGMGNMSGFMQDLINSVEKSKADILISKPSDSETTITIIRNKAQLIASECFAQHKTLSKESVYKIDKSICVSYI